MAEVKQEVFQVWKELVSHPKYLTDLSEKKVVFVAGGGLPSGFGVDDSRIWQALTKRANKDQIKISGVTFTLEELVLLGDYYRFLRDVKGMSLHCIDERLVDDVAHSDHEVHEKCGACAAVAAAAGYKRSIENLLLKELDQDKKQDIYDDMPNHESMTILVDYHGDGVVLDQKREELKEKKALPFNVSMLLALISEWAKTTNQDAQALIVALTKWNVQIARNIIGGRHNTLKEYANDTIIVSDQRKVGKHPLLAFAIENLQSVQHGRLLVIHK